MEPIIPLPLENSSLKSRVFILLAFLLIVAPLTLLFLPSDIFDNGPVLCPSKRFLNIECPGCGLTRATQHFLHGEWEVALDYNPLVVIVVPLLGALWVYQLIALIRYMRAYHQNRKSLSSTERTTRAQ